MKCSLTCSCSCYLKNRKIGTVFILSHSHISAAGTVAHWMCINLQLETVWDKKTCSCYEQQRVFFPHECKNGFTWETGCIVLYCSDTFDWRVNGFIAVVPSHHEAAYRSNAADITLQLIHCVLHGAQVLARADGDTVWLFYGGIWEERHILSMNTQLQAVLVVFPRTVEDEVQRFVARSDALKGCPADRRHVPVFEGVNKPSSVGGLGSLQELPVDVFYISFTARCRRACCLLAVVRILHHQAWWRYCNGAFQSGSCGRNVTVRHICITSVS